MDPIANMISGINNGILVQKESIIVPHSKIKEEILKVLKNANYIDNFQIVTSKSKKSIKIFLAYNNKENNITVLKRISTPGLRTYVGYKKIPRILGGIGDVILSTPK
ncbi:MAG: 30S ribosomal protein S8 [Bacteroidales bacterium]|nr:30S ribosomal protein S8 [Bacteroidales bacterium]